MVKRTPDLLGNDKAEGVETTSDLFGNPAAEKVWSILTIEPTDWKDDDTWDLFRHTTPDLFQK